MPNKRQKQKNPPTRQCRTVKTPNGKTMQYCCQKQNLNKRDLKSYKHLPKCDGSGFPYVEGCYKDMSNWVPGPKQCIIQNPFTSNPNHGSIYTCGFLW